VGREQSSVMRAGHPLCWRPVESRNNYRQKTRQASYCHQPRPPSHAPTNPKANDLAVRVSRANRTGASPGGEAVRPRRTPTPPKDTSAALCVQTVHEATVRTPRRADYPKPRVPVDARK
jgi:hypothetical protein